MGGELSRRGLLGGVVGGAAVGGLVAGPAGADPGTPESSERWGGAAPSLRNRIDWPTFLAGQDLRWRQLPTRWRPSACAAKVRVQRETA